jgi:hypothetical protein
MAGLVPAIHVFAVARPEDVDARHIGVQCTPSFRTAVAGHDAEGASSAFNQTRAFPIHFSNSLSQHSAALFLCGAGYAVVLLFAPQKMRGMARQGAQPLFLCARIPSRKYGAPLGAPPRQACAVWAHLRRLPYGAGPRFSWPPVKYGTASVSQLLAGGPYWPPGGAPAPPGCVPCEARPRAPHPAPPA